jgi:hypothetical protein
MALIKKEMQAGEEAGAAGAPENETAAPGGAQGELTPASVRASMQLPDNLKDVYDRVVLAGMKTMFSKETNQMAMKVLQGQGPIDERLGRGIAALMGLLIKQSNNTMPPQVVIPAGIELVVAAGDYLKKGGQEKVTDDDIAGAMAEFAQIVLDQVGAGSPEKMQQMLQAQQGAPAGAEPAPAAGAEQPPAGGPPQGGVIGNAMGA